MVVNERLMEYKKIEAYIDTFLSTGEGGIIYVSGVPGSGKTYTIKKALKDKEIVCTYINVASLKVLSAIYKTILMDLSCDVKVRNPYYENLRKHMVSCDENHIIIIDEVDMLYTKKQTLLYNIFDLPYLEGTNLLLILVSNTMDIPERLFDPKICSRIGKKRLNFVPYTANQLKSIVSKRKVDTKSVELATKRVASVSGDVRRVIDVLDRAMETRKNKKIDIDDINNVMKTMYSPLYIKYLQNLSFYQKILIYLVKIEKNTVYKVSKLYEDFLSFCKVKDFVAVDFFEFFDIIKQIENFGIFKFKNHEKEIALMILDEEINIVYSNDEDFLNISKKVAYM